MTSHPAGHLPQSDIIAERRGSAGLITLDRPKALNALSLPMIRDLTATLIAWRADPAVHVVAIRGTGKKGSPGSEESRFGSFCAGGDIRFFHQAALSGDPALEDFFTEEYALNHLIQTYPKPYVAFIDGIAMGGGMGLFQGQPLDPPAAGRSGSDGQGGSRRGHGGKVRIVTGNTKMAMPETLIGLFPDVGGGYFLSRCPGHAGEYLALTGKVMDAAEAIGFGLADTSKDAAELPSIWEALGSSGLDSQAAVDQWLATELIADSRRGMAATADIDRYFSLPSLPLMMAELEGPQADSWARDVAATLRQRSPLMLHVALEQIRRARGMALADELRMERSMMHQCFRLRPDGDSEAVEGIRALAVDKDHAPKWKPPRIEAVEPAAVQAFFKPAWPAEAHPLRELH